MRLRRSAIISEPSANRGGYVTFTYVRAAKPRGPDIVSVRLTNPEKHGITAAMRLGLHLVPSFPA